MSSPNSSLPGTSLLNISYGPPVPSSNKGLEGQIDCFGCKIVGSGGAFLMGSYLLYASTVGTFRGGKAYKIFLKSFGYGCIYIAGARLLYLPPFSHIPAIVKPTNVNPVNAMNKK